MKNCTRCAWKVLGLAGMLALCLLLSGCVVQPDDISTNGGYVVTDNDLPFQSLGPKITATPYTPPTATPTPTASPTPNPYQQSNQQGAAQNNTQTFPQNNTGTQQGSQTGAQQGGNIITPVIGVTTNAPVTTSTLKNGSSGSDVKKMQERLKELGYLKGTADGDFGTATETAVKNFQAQNGLAVDGVAGSATLARLYSATARKAPSAVSASTNTPRPTNTPFTSYKKGDSGNEVRKLQQRLKELGYLTGIVDGDFGSATETAVKAFQRNHGLTADGKAGSYTLDKLYSNSAKPAVTATPKPTNTPVPASLKKGDTGVAVKQMQQRLMQLGYMSGPADGEFGDVTERAVRAFQNRHGLTADGKAGTYTLNKLYSDSAKYAVATATPKPTNTPVPAALKKGDQGAAVKEMQQRLRELGYLKSWADGDFGQETEDALKVFQARHGLAADGKAGERTLDKLFSENAKYAVATATPTAKPTNTPKPTATPKAESLDYYLRLGSSGNKVKVLQNRLIELGWLSGKASGNYDAATEYAVTAFQKRYANLWDDGIAGPDTLKIMYGAGAATSKDPVALLGATLEEGAEGDQVKAIQKRLRELGYLKSAVDGDFGSETKAALIAFQTANRITADGKATTATLNKLYAADAKDAKTFAEEQKDAEDAKKEEEVESQDPEDATDIEVGGYTTLREGDRSDAVKELQRALKNRGYYNNYIDGDYAKETIAAVKAFQQHNGLKADGVAGPATQALLFGSSANDADTATSLKKGAYGTEVRNLQYVLYELGYYDGPIDGDYGNTTEDAVRAFQINNNLTPVDGIAGTRTLKVLYSGKAIGATASSGVYEPLSKGDKGTLVVEMQEVLAKLGYLVEVTGEYDSATVNAVKNFQTRNDLYVDGKAGQETLSVLYSKNPTPAW